MADIPPRQQVSGSDTIRMGQSEGLPKFDDPAASREDPVYRETAAYGTLARRPTTTADDPAFAILKAFQDYMEHERQRAQRRTTAVIISFAALLVILTIGFFAIWFSTMHGMQGTQNDLIKAAIAARENSEPKVDVAAAIATAVEKATSAQNAAITAAAAQAEKLAAERAAAERNAEKVAADAAKAIEEERIRAAKELDERLAAERKKNEEASAAKEAALAKALEKLGSTIEAVKKDNDKLRKDNEALKAVATAKPAVATAKPAVATSKPTAATAAQPQASAKPTATSGKQAGSGAAPAPSAKPAAPAKPAAKQAPAVRPAPPVEVPPGKAVVAEVKPEITVKRPAPPKGFSAETFTLPVGDKGESQITWHMMVPNELPKEERDGE